MAIEFEFTDAVDEPTAARADSGRKVRCLHVPLERLRDRGVLPPEGAAWRPEGWRAFLQTETESGGGRPSGVASALAPVAVRLRFVERFTELATLAHRGAFEERRAARRDDPPVDLRGLQPRVHRCLDHHEIAGAPELREEGPEVGEEGLGQAVSATILAHATGIASPRPAPAARCAPSPAPASWYAACP